MKTSTPLLGTTFWHILHEVMDIRWIDSSVHSLDLDSEQSDQVHVQPQRVSEQSMFAGYWGILDA